MGYLGVFRRSMDVPDVFGAFKEVSEVSGDLLNDVSDALQEIS